MPTVINDGSQTLEDMYEALKVCVSRFEEESKIDSLNISDKIESEIDQTAITETVSELDIEESKVIVSNEINVVDEFRVVSEFRDFIVSIKEDENVE